MHLLIYILTSTTKYGNTITVCSTNTSFQNISTPYLIVDTSTVNSGLLCQSKTSANLLKRIPHTGGAGNNNPATQTGDMLYM